MKEDLTIMLLTAYTEIEFDLYVVSLKPIYLIMEDH